MKNAWFEGVTWTGHAVWKLSSFVEAACQDEKLRRLLKSNPVMALREWQWEFSCIPDELPPPVDMVSATIDEESLLGPVGWRTEPDKELLCQTQLRLLLAGVKPLALIHGDEQSLTGLASWARTRGFFTLLSPHEFLPQFDACKGGYSNSMIKVVNARAGSGAWRGLLIAHDEQSVLMAWLCLLFGWENFLGRLLGYPPCCCNAFESRWLIAASNYEGDVGLMMLTEVQLQSAQHTYNLSWTANIFARYFGWEIIQHFPCKWDCLASENLARRYFSVLSHYWPTDSLELLRYLKSPLMIIPSKGYCLFPDGQMFRKNNEINLVYDPKLVRIIGMDNMLVKGILSSARLTSNLNWTWNIAGSDVSGHLIEVSF